MRQIVDAPTRQQGKDRETHLNVGHAERVPGKPAVLSEMRINKARMRFQLGIEIRFLHPLTQRLAQESDAWRHGRLAEAVENQLH